MTCGQKQRQQKKGGLVFVKVGKRAQGGTLLKAPFS
jgi:hypothetical protein